MTTTATETTAAALPPVQVEAVVRTWIYLRMDELKEQIMLCYDTYGERCDESGVCPHKAACDAIWLAIRDSANEKVEAPK